MRKLILTTASVLALGIGGAGVGQAADTSGMAPNTGSNMPAMSGTASYSKTTMNQSKDEVRQAQQQLQDQGLYHGRIDGILGRQTEQALGQFQRKNGLSQTATLDQPTMEKLLGNTGAGQGPACRRPFITALGQRQIRSLLVPVEADLATATRRSNNCV